MNSRFSKRKTIALILSVIFSWASVPLAAAPTGTGKPPANGVQLTAPANDNFADAQLLASPSGSITGSTVGATKESGEPVHARNRGGASVWYKYLAPTNGVLTIDTLKSGFDTTLAVYQGSSVKDLVLVAANDDTQTQDRSSVTVGAKANDLFYIAVDGFYNVNTATLATGTVQLDYAFGTVAANDNFADAQWLGLPSGKLITATNVGASKEPFEPTIGANNGGRSVWFKWTAPPVNNRSYTFTIESSKLAGSGSVKILCAVYSGDDLNALSEKVTNDRTKGNELTFVADPGVTYYLAIDGYDYGTGAETGTFTLNYGPAREDKTPD